jgi:hypothetical protein
MEILKKNKLSYKHRRGSEYLSMVSYKNIIVIKKSNDYSSAEAMTERIAKAKEYKLYYIDQVKKDNLDNKVITHLDLEKEKNKRYLNIRENKNKRVVELFNTNSEKRNINVNYANQNMFNEHIEDIKGRRTWNKLVKPHYFFTAGYIEKSKISQIKNWSNSVYNFIKREKTGNNYLDIYTSKLIKLFFAVKYLKKKDIWSIKLLSGIKILADLPILNDLNIVMGYTTRRSNAADRKESYFKPLFLTLNWVTEQLTSSIQMGNMINLKKNDIFGGFYPRKKTYIRKLNRVLLSKPLFKHTSFNLIIDLFIFNNKRNKFRKLQNLIVRRSTYKYMSSMYFNYYTKIQETINRPRFFYLNIIDPSVIYYYRRIVNYYRGLLVRKPFGVYLFLSLLQLRIIKKKYLYPIYNKVINRNFVNGKLSNIGNNITETQQDEVREFPFKRRLYTKNIRRNNLSNNINGITNSLPLNTIERLKSEVFNKDKKRVEIGYNKAKVDAKKKNKKYVTNIESEYLKYKKYIAEFNRKSDKPIDMSTVTMWSTEKLGKKFNKFNIMDNKKGKKFNKFNIMDNKRDAVGFNFSTHKPRYNDINSTRENNYNERSDNFRKFAKYEVWKFGGKLKKMDNIEYSMINVKRNLRTKHKGKKKDKIKIDLKYKYIDVKEIPAWSKSTYPVMEKNAGKINIIPTSDKMTRDMKDQSRGVRATSSPNPISGYSDAEIGSESIKPEISLESTENKVKYVESIFNNDVEGNRVLDPLYISFYYNKNYRESNINETKESELLIRKTKQEWEKKENVNSKNKDIIIKEEFMNKTNHEIYSIKRSQKVHAINKQKFISNKWISGKRDSTTADLLSKYINFTNKKQGFDNTNFDFNFVYNKVINNKKFGNFWYLMHFISIIQKEYSNISKDVLMSKTDNIIPSSYNQRNLVHYAIEEDIKENVNLYYISKKGEMHIEFWPNLNTNENESSFKLGYNEKLFKPYYRQIIPYLFIKYYKLFMISLRNNNLLSNINNKFSFRSPVIYNFISVKILLDLLHYNYRSLIKLKPKYYFINKLRYYKTKYNRKNINSWRIGVRYLKKLRRTPKLFWIRYDALVRGFFDQIVQNAELETTRKIFVPFVIYFEDILFTIYGKWVIIRLWPLKKFFLSSFILARRVLILIIWRRKKYNGQFSFRAMTSRLIHGFRALQIKRSYVQYIKNAYKWPKKLVNIMNDGNHPLHLNYNTLEHYVEKIDRLHSLNSYVLTFNKLSIIWSPYSTYLSAFKKNLRVFRRSYKRRRILRNKIDSTQLVYFWLRPLKQYIKRLISSMDISGVKFRLTGRIGTKRNNLRSQYKASIYGNFFGPFIYTAPMLRPKTLPLQFSRGQIKSNIDYSYSVSKTRNGAVSFKVWISSLVSTDVHELLLHLVRIKDLYTQLINRYYVVNSRLAKIKHNYNLIDLKERLKRKKKRYRKRKKFRFRFFRKYK